MVFLIVNWKIRSFNIKVKSASYEMMKSTLSGAQRFIIYLVNYFTNLRLQSPR